MTTESIDRWQTETIRTHWMNHRNFQVSLQPMGMNDGSHIVRNPNPQAHIQWIGGDGHPPLLKITLTTSVLIKKKIVTFFHQNMSISVQLNHKSLASGRLSHLIFICQPLKKVLETTSRYKQARHRPGTPNLHASAQQNKIQDSNYDAALIYIHVLVLSSFIRPDLWRLVMQVLCLSQLAYKLICNELTLTQGLSTHQYINTAFNTIVQNSTEFWFQ